jgi:hypothetical protein
MNMVEMVAAPRGGHTAHTTSSRDVPYDVHMRSTVPQSGDSKS